MDSNKQTLEVLFYFHFSWLCVILTFQQGIHGHHESRSAEPTLRAMSLCDPLLYMGIIFSYHDIIMIYTTACSAQLL